MQPTTLNYVAPGARVPFRWNRRRVVGFAAVLLLVVILTPFPDVKFVSEQIDPVTGSMSIQTTWAMGLHTSAGTQVSPLEKRLTQSHIAWTPAWQMLGRRHYNLFGNVTTRECGSAPPIYHMRPLMDEFVARATDEELRAFVNVMQSGTTSEQSAAISAACERMLAQLRAEVDKVSKIECSFP